MLQAILGVQGVGDWTHDPQDKDLVPYSLHTNKVFNIEASQLFNRKQFIEIQVPKVLSKSYTKPLLFYNYMTQEN